MTSCRCAGKKKERKSRTASATAVMAKRFSRFIIRFASLNLLRRELAEQSIGAQEQDGDQQNKSHRVGKARWLEHPDLRCPFDKGLAKPHQESADDCTRNGTDTADDRRDKRLQAHLDTKERKDLRVGECPEEHPRSPCQCG